MPACRLCGVFGIMCTNSCSRDRILRSEILLLFSFFPQFFHHRQHTKQSFIYGQILAELKRMEFSLREGNGKWLLLNRHESELQNTHIESTWWRGADPSNERMKRIFGEGARSRWRKAFRIRAIVRKTNWQHTMNSEHYAVWTAIRPRRRALSMAMSKWRNDGGTLPCKFYIQFTLCWMCGEPQFQRNINSEPVTAALSPRVALVCQSSSTHIATPRFLSKSHNFPGDGW